LADGTACGFGYSNGVFFGTCCSGQCVDQADPNNCGGCGLQCPSGECVSSPFGGVVCTPPPGGNCTQSCPEGTACLGTTCQSVTCVSVFSGFCPAPDGNVGLCAALGDAGTYTCVDVTSDPNNCGAVGVPCICSGTPAPCNVPGALGSFCNLDAGLGWNCCQGIGCTNLFDDPNNCGTCGASCAQGQTCTQGNCG
jgi:hypothetical protein